MGLFSKKIKNDGFMDVIRCDEPSYLVWKWHPAGSQLNENNRENAIRWGSSLRVKEGEVAVFVYKQEDGTMMDYIEGPFDQIIKTNNFPVLASIIGMAYEGDTPFQAEVYFINLARIIQIKFGIPYFDVFDPRFSDLAIPTAVRGTITFKISDYREFIKLHRLSNFDLDNFQNEIKDAVVRYVKNIVVNAPIEHSIPVIQIERKVSEINESIEIDLKDRLKEDFGVTVSGIDISAIEIDKTANEYIELKSITQDVTTATIHTQTAANIKDIQDKQRIEVENYEEILRIQREEGRYAQHKQTESANLSAFQVEKQAEVGVASANAFGQMNENGVGNVDLGGGMGLNPVSMMAGMTLGGAMGQNIANTMTNVMSGTNMTPPPVPKQTYYVVVNDEATGPFDLDTLKQMGLNASSLVWKPGMSEWVKAATLTELNGLLSNMPPIPQT